MKYYYADELNKTAGPVTLEALKELIKEGKLNADPMVVIQGQTDWKLLSATSLQPPSPPTGMTQATQAAEQAKAASKDALEVLKLIATDPVGSLPSAFEKLGSHRAMRAGFALGSVSVVCALFLVYRTISGLGAQAAFGDLFKILLVSVVPFASLLAVCIGIKKLFKGEGALGHDAFIAGTAQLPTTILLLATAILGMGNVEVLIVIGLFSLCLTVLMLFSGFVRIYKIKEQTATYAVPLAILVNVWLCKIIYSSMFSHFLN
jgi:hypothetical protein